MSAPANSPRNNTWRRLLDQATSAIGVAHEARRIVEEASGLPRADLMRVLDDTASDVAAAHCRAMVDRRVRGEPLQYALGSWGFRTLDLMVDRRVLIPRPETEQVAEAAIQYALGLRRDVTAVDLGTGSGAIALSLAAEVPRAEVWATDQSAEALDVARANLAGIGMFAAPRVHLVQGSWFDPLPDRLRGRVDLVVSNPPYVADGEELPQEVSAWEPAAALRAGPTGLECFDEILSESPSWLAPGGVVVLEIAPHQAGDVKATARRAGLETVEVRSDLAGHDRVVIAAR